MKQHRPDVCRRDREFNLKPRNNQVSFLIAFKSKWNQDGRPFLSVFSKLEATGWRSGTSHQDKIRRLVCLFV